MSRILFRLFLVPLSQKVMLMVAYRAVLSVCTVCICLAGCGGNSTSSSTPISNTCTGVVISGTMEDSLTFQPVAQGVAVLESGTQTSSSGYDFSPAKQVAADAHGAFKLCVPAVTSPSAIILEALDAAGKVYPPYVASVTGAADLGTIPMGGCTGTCGFEGSQQTTLPATITGMITTAPIAKTGLVAPLYTMSALDGSKDSNGHSILWALDLPIFNSSPTTTFSTASTACAGTAPFCATYSFSVPSQKPVRPYSGGYLQEAGTPSYLISAVPDGPALCSPASEMTASQQDGTLSLPGNPGAQITVAEIDFTKCK